MTTTFAVRVLCASLVASLTLAAPARAEDIDLFTNPSPPPLDAPGPNILIVLDNSANWNRNDQGWTDTLTGINPYKQGQAELRALRTLMDDPVLTERINFGLFMFSSGNPDSGYPRFHIRPMDDSNRKAFKELIGPDTGCVDGPNTLNGTPNCMFKNFSTASEQTNAASTRYSSALFEAFKYFGGYTDPAKALLNLPGAPIDRTHFGQERYGALSPNTDRDAWQNPGTKTHWQTPLNPKDAECPKNYVIFIGNGYPSQDVADSLLTGINGNATTPAGFGNKSWKVANWSKYMHATDVNEAAGRQYITTYTIDVFKNKPDPDNQAALLKAMAKYGGGRYFEAKDEQAILNALKEILTEIQSVNAVFASASLPINATNRSQNENQVFIGMFRPDPKGLPRWYGNLKQYQIALFGADARLADKNGQETVSATTGFVQACATSFWTTDSGNYWEFSPPSTGACTTAGTLPTSDSPDGSVVEKGGAGEVLRRGNKPALAAPFKVNRKMYTCTGLPCATLTDLDTTSVTATRTGAATDADNKLIVDYTFGKDVNDENGNNFLAPAGIGIPAGVDEPRPSIHADIAHSRPLPVNFADKDNRGVEVFYGANDGPLRAVNGQTGEELWSFVAPDHHSKLKRLHANFPLIQYPNQPIVPTSLKKDYFFDGSLGLYQDGKSDNVWIYATMRRGGRMVYAFDISKTDPALRWAFGCPNLTDDTDCTPGAEGIGQTWSVPNVAFIKGYSETKPVVIIGGGYDACEDSDTAVTTCLKPKGSKVFVLDAIGGKILQEFDVDGPVAADVTLMSRFFLRDSTGDISFVDTAYVATTRGSIYRLDFVKKDSGAELPDGSWTATRVARTTGANRKFLFGPSALAIGKLVYLALGSGDRERPLINNYPYLTPVKNRFYMAIDDLASTDLDLDGDKMENFTKVTDCASEITKGGRGWYMDLNTGDQGEQTVTSSVIFGGTIFFSTNRPTKAEGSTCATNLGEARGYAVNLFNASGVIGTGGLCGGDRSGIFTGGGIPPSPVVGTVPVSLPGNQKKPINVLIGGIDLKTGGGSPIGAQQPPVPIQQIRSRIYWFPKGDR